MLLNLRNFMLLSPAEKRWFLAAWLRLLAAALAVRALSFQRVERSFGGRAAARSRPLPLPVERMGALLEVAGRHHLLAIGCLERSLALRWILAAHGIGTELRLGVRRSGREVEAHAWLERDGSPVVVETHSPAFEPFTSTNLKTTLIYSSDQR